FCTTFEAMDPASSPAARAVYINGHDVSGIQTPDSSTIVFTLTQPATDFLNILALPFASAAPVENLSYVPATPGHPVYSDGPYQAFPQPGNSGPGLVRFNFFSPNNHGALANLKIRRALEYAIDKVRINAIFGGPSLAEPLNQVIGPGAEGYVPFNDYPTPGNKGDPAKCKRLLQRAGVRSLTLKDLYKTYLPIASEVFQAEQADFAKCGVIVV